MQAKIYTADQHGIDPRQIDPDALWVISRLRQSGYEAYLVGGGVRDLLVGITPKDFDLSTSASPEQIKEVFRRQCILIGRRFRLAHIRFGKKVIEVSTFRSGDLNDAELILRDNRWGTAEEDVLRRDFTINGFFYDSVDNTVIDYVEGWKDIQSRTLRSIGQSEVRFQQDPVRMLRALKFVARLDFTIEPETESAIRKCRLEIAKSSAARILEEMFKMLESRASSPFFRLMTDYGFTEILFPCLNHFLVGPHSEDVYLHLASTDAIKEIGHPTDRSLLIAAMIYPILEKEVASQYTSKEEHPSIGDIMLLVSGLIKGVILSSFPHFPRRIAGGVSYILNTQFRLTPTTGKRHFRPRTFQQKEFPLALELLRIRAQVDTSLEEEYNDWKQKYHRARHSGEKRHHPPPKQSKKRRPARG